MNATYIVTSYVVIDDVLKAIGHTDDIRTHVSSAEILTVAIIAAKYFQNVRQEARVSQGQTARS
jgi:hypothetical protein